MKELEANTDTNRIYGCVQHINTVLWYLTKEDAIEDCGEDTFIFPADIVISSDIYSEAVMNSAALYPTTKESLMDIVEANMRADENE